MRIGLLWFDNDPRQQLDEKVARAAAYYQQKYGRLPTLCYVNPSVLNGSEHRVGPIEVRPARTVPPHHFWLGIAQEDEPLKQAA